MNLENCVTRRCRVYRHRCTDSFELIMVIIIVYGGTVRCEGEGDG